MGSLLISSMIFIATSCHSWGGKRRTGMKSPENFQNNGFFHSDKQTVLQNSALFFICREGQGSQFILNLKFFKLSSTSVPSSDEPVDI